MGFKFEWSLDNIQFSELAVATFRVSAVKYRRIGQGNNRCLPSHSVSEKSRLAKKPSFIVSYVSASHPGGRLGIAK
jgi:hypothetical protein